MNDASLWHWLHQDRPIVFLDTETTGLHPGREAWEIAMIRRDPDGTPDVELTLHVRIDYLAADPVALQIGRYHERFTKADSIRPVDAANIVADRLKGATIVGAIPSFDTITLENLLRRHGLEPTWHHRLRCVESMTAGYMGTDVGGLADCAYQLGLDFPVDVQHTALGDARMCAQIWDSLVTP